MLSVGARSHRFSPSKNVSIAVIQAVVVNVKNAARMADKPASPRCESEIARKVGADADCELRDALDDASEPAWACALMIARIITSRVRVFQLCSFAMASVPSRRGAEGARGAIRAS
jgi:hypothetical protein